MSAIARVVGVELTLTRVGVAVITRRVNGTCITTCATFTSLGPRGEERIPDLASCADRAVCDAVLAVVGPSAAGEVEDLRSAVLAAVRARGAPVHVVSIAEQLVDVAELWPAIKLANVGEVTALRLAHAGALRLGWPVGDRRGVA